MLAPKEKLKEEEPTEPKDVEVEDLSVQLMTRTKVVVSLACGLSSSFSSLLPPPPPPPVFFVNVKILVTLEDKQE